ncbi:hypothetical protein HG536_0A02570 [Torulaspora globosa]|uniref:Uncharacterized protein n=1 Tax=Torulaspora globosa TaxID=48254 RepID=A0A7G3ZAA4_9SACH|nr:uncharacterized protein HG536_0A02570 [Torulaspora globosa]QLL30440.1 hypothetical protein HG536_0A02570 [Torulaspora globosa]
MSSHQDHYKRRKEGEIAMLTSVEDLLEIDDRIASIESERSQLAAQLELARQAAEKKSSVARKIEVLASEIAQRATDLDSVRQLKAQYGDLKVLCDLEKLYVLQEEQQMAQDQLRQVGDELSELSLVEPGQISLDTLSRLHAELSRIRRLLNTPSPVYDSFESVLRSSANDLSNKFNRQLLESKWDTPAFVPISTQTIETMRGMSTTLYRLSQLRFTIEEEQTWNFKCIANNFTIRFTYHFHDGNFKLETYFKFLNDYLTENLHKCIGIFHDESFGLTKEYVLDQFIDHVLFPIRREVRSNLMKDDRSVKFALISQILTTDRSLTKNFHYHGDGLVPLIPAEVWDIWLSYEVSTATRQFQQITKDPKDMAKSATDFVRLVNKIYDSLSPFYSFEAESLKRYKLLTCSQIFISLSSAYMDYLLAVDALDEHRTAENELYQTLIKLQNFNVVYRRIFELSQEFVMIQLTETVNLKEGTKYQSLFQNILGEYKKVIDEEIQPSVVRRIKKLLKETLRNYFKIGSWSTLTRDSSVMSAEIVNAVKLLSRIIKRLDALDISLEACLGIKNELLNIIVNYFIESILKLNRFNHAGLKQLEFDFHALKESLNLPETVSNCQDTILRELLKVLFAKYDDSCRGFFDSSYIKTSEFSALRDMLSISALKDSEIQDALYRVAYGSII